SDRDTPPRSCQEWKTVGSYRIAPFVWCGGRSRRSSDLFDGVGAAAVIDDDLEPVRMCVKDDGRGVALIYFRVKEVVSDIHPVTRHHIFIRQDSVFIELAGVLLGGLLEIAALCFQLQETLFDLLQCHHAGSLLSRLLSLSSSLLLDGFIWIESIGEYLVNVAFFLLPLLPVLIEPAECFSGHVRVVSGSMDHPFLQHGDPFPDGDGFLLHDHHLLPFAFFNHHYTDQYPDNHPPFFAKNPRSF